MCNSSTLVAYTTGKQIDSSGVEMDVFKHIFRSYCIRKAVLKRPSNFCVVRSENRKKVYKLSNSKNAYTLEVN